MATEKRTALVVGLGNPGREYDGTRHNVGFELIDRLAQHFHAPAMRQEHKAETARTRIGDVDVILAKPLTFMNVSGEAVGALARYYKVAMADVIVAHDELDFEPGVVRLKVGGGHGGNNGVRSIISHLGADFVRLRIGIGKPPSADRGADWVLSRFDKAARARIDEALVVAQEAVEGVLTKGAVATMNAINSRA